MILKIDAEKLLVLVDEYLQDIDIGDISEALPDSVPRFVIVSTEFQHKDGRISYPLVGRMFLTRRLLQSRSIKHEQPHAVCKHDPSSIQQCRGNREGV